MMSMKGITITGLRGKMYSIVKIQNNNEHFYLIRVSEYSVLPFSAEYHSAKEGFILFHIQFREGFPRQVNFH